jgi:hypothetical protein
MVCCLNESEALMKATKRTYQNTFESLGDPAPAKMESVREYARELLPMFDPDKPGYYRIDPQPPEARVGSVREIAWWDRLYDACEQTEESGVISEARLLDFLEEAVEET